MMSWRLHLTNRTISDVHILEGDPLLLAAWSRRDRVAYYELETGTPLEERVFRPPPDRRASDWQDFISELKAPNGTVLPFFQGMMFDTYLTDDGRMRLYYEGGAQLYLETEGREIALEAEESEDLRAIALDRFLGLSAALDDSAHIHLYQQHIHVGRFNLGLSPLTELRPQIAIARGGGSIFVTDGRQIVLTDSSGKPRRGLDAHYFVNKMDCSPGGNFLITSDVDTGVIRVYDGADLTLLFQRFAIDLLAHAVQVQLLADLPPVKVAPNALTIDNQGVIAFALSGVLCVTHTSHMDALPRPQALL
jgi:hypothetical protein